MFLRQGTRISSTATRAWKYNHYQQHSLLSSASAGFALRESYEYIIASKKYDGKVGLIELNRPEALNALSDALFEDLVHASKSMDSDPEVGCLVITGNEKVFAAGADIAEMKDRDYAYAYKTNMFAGWADIAKLKKPTIAAVNGFALGGGCELAMMCDIILAGERCV